MFKKFLFISLSIGIVLFASSCNKQYEKLEVVKDCTGSYLRTKGGLDFYVCNFAILNEYPTGKKIKVKYDVLNTCFGLIEDPSCEVEHVYEEVIDVIEIKD